jgi:hypothetical protein
VSLTPTAPSSPGSAGVSPTPTSAAPGAYTTFPNTVIDRTTTAVPPPGDTETVTTQADGTITTVIANAAGAPVDTTITIVTADESGGAAAGQSVNLWA